MDCYGEDVWWLLYDDRLGSEEAARLREHLRSCPRCQALCGEVRRLGSALSALGPDRTFVEQTSRQAISRYQWRRRGKAVAAG